MPTRQQLIEEARSWKGTRWEHQGEIKGLAADCEGFVAGVAKNSGVEAVVEIVRNYRRREDGSLMLKLLNEQLDYVTGSETRETPDMSSVLPADIVAFSDERLAQPDRPKHLGIITNRRADGVWFVIHASEQGVVEHRLDMRWLKRIHSVWSIRGIVNDLD